MEKCQEYLCSISGSGISTESAHGGTVLSACIPDLLVRHFDLIFDVFRDSIDGTNSIDTFAQCATCSCERICIHMPNFNFVGSLKLASNDSIFLNAIQVKVKCYKL